MIEKEHIVVIDPGLRIAETDCYNNFLSMSSLPCTYHLPGQNGAGSLERENTEFVKAIIVFGGSASLTENLDWRLKLEKWFQKCILHKIPVLAFCWGHQWIAHLFGGSIGLIESGKRKGFKEIYVRDCNLYSDSRGDVAVAHRAFVNKVPVGARIIAESDEVFCEALEYSEYPIYSFQSHPEATLEYLVNNKFDISGNEDFTFGHMLVKRFVKWVATSEC